jgi:hypothetical protein
VIPLRFDAGPPDSPPDLPEPDEDLDPDLCPGCGSTEAEGCPRECPERALDEAADLYDDRTRDPGPG